MEITIVQAVLIGLWTGVCLSGMLLGIYTNRCLIMATGVGLILGDLPRGLAMGEVGQLAFMDSEYLREEVYRRTRWGLES